MHIVANVSQRKLKTQQLIAYQLEKQDHIQKNTPKKKDLRKKQSFKVDNGSELSDISLYEKQ